MLALMCSCSLDVKVLMNSASTSTGTPSGQVRKCRTQLRATYSRRSNFSRSSLRRFLICCPVRPAFRPNAQCAAIHPAQSLQVAVTIIICSRNAGEMARQVDLARRHQQTR